jgi:hypothetical protein
VCFGDHVEPWLQDTLIRAELDAYAAERAEVRCEAAVVAETEVNLASLEHRWHRAVRTSATVIITCTDGHIVRGQCSAALQGFIVLTTAAGMCAVSTTHLAAVTGLPHALASEIQSPQGPRHLISAQPASAEIAQAGGHMVVGHIVTSGTDHLDVQCGDGPLVTVPLNSILRIHWRR